MKPGQKRSVRDRPYCCSRPLHGRKVNPAATMNNMTFPTNGSNLVGFSVDDQPYDPQPQGPFQFVYRWWCDDTLHVPPFPEPRHYRAIFQYLRTWSREPADLRMIIGTRGGLVEFYEGDRVEYLQPAK